ncbi:MAG: segregation/condensation protein A [Parcubacteria group bacterium]|nr:segregation/condensation protein A [Parcubacteria group bacterium]
MTKDGYHVHTKIFEGPLELLLDLIERRKLHINDVSLSEIADDYLAYIEKLGDFPTKDAAQFLVVASTLVLIKSRSLLPSLVLSEEEQASIDDLEGRLALLKRARELTAIVGARFGETPLFYRDAEYRGTPVFSPHADIKKLTILSVIRELIKNLPRRESIPQVIVRKVVSMEEMMNDLTERIRDALSISFRDFASAGGGSSSGGNGGDKTKIVIGFLAILELVKRGIISVRQNERFEDIEIEGMEVGVPRYY